MLAVALALLSLAALVGAILLTPRRAILARVPRSTTAAAHGVLGASGLAAFLFVAGTQTGSQTIWLAIGLLTAGLIGGITIFVTGRHRRPPPVLLLALHIVFAGMGYLLFVGLLLS